MTAKPLRVLLVEDNPRDAELILEELRRHNFDVNECRVETEEAFRECLHRDFDVILLDYRLPAFDALRALRILLENRVDIPCILVSGTVEEEVAVEAMKLGAADYLMKDRLARLGIAVNQALENRFLRSERASAWASLTESEERFRQLAENIEEVFWLLDTKNDKVLYVSPTYEKTWGRPCSALYSSSSAWLEAVHEEDLLRICAVTDALRHIGRYDEEYRIRRPDGSVRWIHDRAFPVRTSDGTIRRVVGVASDITDRKIAEEQARSRGEMLSSIPGVVWETRGEPGTAEEHIHYVSGYVQSLLGYSVDEWLTTPNFWLSIVHPDDREQAAQRAKEIFDGSANIENEFRWIAKDGREVWIDAHASIVRNEAGKAIGLRGINLDITRRRNAEEAARRHKEMLQTIFDHIPVMITYRDPDAQLQVVNREWERALGWSLAEARTVDLRMEFYPALVERERVDAFIRNADGSPGDFQIRTRSGTLLDTRWITVRLSDGTTVSLGWDITKSKAASDALRSLAAETRLLLESTSEGIYGIDLANRCTFINAAAAEMVGYAPEEVLGRNMHDLLHHTRSDGTPYPREACPILRTSQCNERSRIDTEVFWRKDGRMFPVEYSTNPLIENGVRRGSVIVFSDITERNERQRQIREQARVLDLAHDAISVHDLDDRVQYWNRGAERLFGWTAEEMGGADVRALLYAENGSYDLAKAAVLEVGEWHGEMTLGSKDGREIIVSARWTLVRDEAGEPKSVLVIKTDITEQKLLEGRFLRAQRLESIGTLASGVAHDLNNILSPILMSASMLRDPVPPETFEMLVSTIETSAQRGSDIVKQVLTFARGVKGERTSLQPKHLLREMEQIAIQTFPKKIEIRNGLAPDLANIEGDSTQLHQVLLNLCVNARDAMPNGGTLTISGENFEMDENYAAMVPGAKPGNYVQIAVTDTGTGIPNHVLNQIFDPFFTTKDPGDGTGLGLSTVMGIVKSHGGFLNVYTEVGSGSTFRVYLPVASGEESSHPPESGAPAGNGEKILLVDDEVSIRTVTAAVLEKNGYEVITACDGAEALAIYAQQGREISAVLTDIMMPLMDGHDLIRALRRLNPRTRIIASTGHYDERSRDELHSRGVESILSKPYNTARLLSAIHEMLTVPPMPQSGGISGSVGIS